MDEAVGHTVTCLWLESLLSDLILQAAAVEVQSVLIEKVCLSELHVLIGALKSRRHDEIRKIGQ